MRGAAAAGDRYRFIGRELTTVEIDGWCDAGSVRLPARLSPDLDGGRARVSLFAFRVDPLRVVNVPLLKFRYAEVLWRIAVRDGNTPAWWVTACDLHARGPRFAAARYVRYPVREMSVDVDDGWVSTRNPTAVLTFFLSLPTTIPAAVEIRPLLVGPEAQWRVPWGDDGEAATSVAIRVECDSLGELTLGAPVEWAGTARVRRGRQHRCGVAEPSA